MTNRRDRGFTFLEILMTLAITALVMTAVYLVLSSSTRTQAATTRLANIQEQARRVLDEMANELRDADSTTVVVTGGDRIQFRKNTGYAAGAVTWSSLITFEFQPSPVDANENGLADEGRIVRTQVGEPSRTLCHYVRANGLAITLTGSNVVIRLTVVNGDGKGKVIQSFVESSVTLRNAS